MSMKSESGTVRISPGVRLTGGAVLLAGVLLSDAGSNAGISAMIILVLASFLQNRVRPARVVGIMTVGGLMYLPVILLASLPVAIKGFSSALVLLAATSGMTARDLHSVVIRLPVPAFVRLLLLQMLHQTEVLRRETLRVHQALIVRGGMRGFRDTLVFARAIPMSWMPRMIFRAERVALAMDVRGYGDVLPSASRLSLSPLECFYLVWCFCLALGGYLLSRPGLL
jgi:hypothetical protein